MLIKEMKYSYNDIAIVPAIKSNVEHRSECNPYTGKFGESSLPIFTAPMSTVVNVHNFELFEQNHIIPILPRNFPLETRIYYLKRGKWAAVGLQEFEDLFLNNDWDMELYPDVNVLIDIANGHMTKLHNIIYDAKTKYKWSNRFKIMAGNIANPQTYYEMAKAGVDFVRVGIGGGCFVKGTQVNTINGLKNIEDITDEDIVLTHKNNHKNVVDTTKKEYDGKIININGIRSTPDHLYFVVNKIDADKVNEKNYLEYGFWLSAEEIDEEKHLLIKL